MLKLRKRGGTWHVYGTARGQRIRRDTHETDKEAAERVLEHMLLNVKAGRPAEAGTTVAEACDYYLEHRGDVSDSTVYQVRRFQSEMGGMKLRDLTVADLHSWVDRELRGRKPSSKRKALTIANAVLRFVHERGWCDLIVAPRPAETGTRERWFTESEMDALLLNAPEYIWPLVLFLSMTGARCGEATGLEWKDVQQSGGDYAVVLRNRKGKGVVRPRNVPLNPRAVEALREQARLNGQAGVPLERRIGRVFRNFYGFGWSGSAGVRAAFKVAAERAGVEDATVHDLRRTFASRLVQRGVDLKTVAELLGHSGLGMVTKYAHLAPSAKKSAVLMI